MTGEIASENSNGSSERCTVTINCSNLFLKLGRNDGNQGEQFVFSFFKQNDREDLLWNQNTKE